MGQSAGPVLERGPANEDARVTPTPSAGPGVDSPYAWLRLAAAATLGTVGGAGMWSVPVALPAGVAPLYPAEAGRMSRAELEKSDDKQLLKALELLDEQLK